MLRLAGTRVLIVEDEPLIASQIADELSDEGATIIGPFADIEEALAAVQQATPTAAILDWWLCFENAASAALALAARKIPLIIHTGFSLGPAELSICPGAVVVNKPAPEGALVDELFRLTQKIAPAA